MIAKVVCCLDEDKGAYEEDKGAYEEGYIVLKGGKICIYDFLPPIFPLSWKVWCQGR